jgi:hypothetical protein
LVRYEAPKMHLRAGIRQKPKKSKVSSGPILGAGTVTNITWPNLTCGMRPWILFFVCFILFICPYPFIDLFLIFVVTDRLLRRACVPGRWERLPSARDLLLILYYDIRLSGMQSLPGDIVNRRSTFFFLFYWRFKIALTGSTFFLLGQSRSGPACQTSISLALLFTPFFVWVCMKGCYSFLCTSDIRPWRTLSGAETPYSPQWWKIKRVTSNLGTRRAVVDGLVGSCISKMAR